MKSSYLILIVILIIIVTISIVLAYNATHGRRQTLDESINYQLDTVPGLREIFNRDEFINYTVKDHFGYLYHVSYLPAKCDSNKFIIFAHGYTDTRFGMLKYMNFYRKMGFHCVFFDERGHGENKRVACTYGVKEIRGLLTVLDDTTNRYGDHIKIGLHGESLGGATVLFSYGYDLKGKVSFIVDDCGFCSIMPVMRNVFKSMHLPAFLLEFASLASLFMYGYTFHRAKPIKKVSNPNAEIPLLIIHGAADDFIFPEHSQKIHDAFCGYKELYFIDNATHATSATTNPSKYSRILGEFLDRINFWY